MWWLTMLTSTCGCRTRYCTDGLAVMGAWGFRYVSNLVWAKRRKDGGPDGRGVGFYFRNVTELILFGVRGSMRTLAPARRQVNMIETRKREHSRKPDEQYDLIEDCSPGPFLEMFTRHSRKGWSVWGDESAEDAVPRGKTYRGYAGGPLLVPPLKPHERLTPENQVVIGGRLRKEYEAGASIREISQQTGYLITRVRALLIGAGAEFREAGKH
ncbi:MT-A70 family methyltransferase [Actinomyces trachealis]|uniref:MT-A70 family methyltransferase n=1 Tax=Actinomyces trachealis TaxID=2763540 RepID=UPI003145330D